MESITLARRTQRKSTSPIRTHAALLEKPRHSTVTMHESVPFFRSESWQESAPTFRPLLTSLSSSVRCSTSEPGEKDSQRGSMPRRFCQSVSNITKKSVFGTQMLDLKYSESTLSQGSLPNEDSLYQDFLDIRPKTPFEVVDSYTDTRCGLEIRKSLMRVWQAFREICKLITTNSLFQTGIILAILLNTVLLALEDPSLEVQPEPYFSIETTLLYIYTVEMGLKVIALGFILRRGSYIRDPWNVLDFIVVVSGWIELEYGGSGINLSALRALRILRPLRSITRIKGMKIVFLSLVGSVRNLFSSIMLLVFFYLITAIAALQMFMGVLKMRCMNIDTGDIGSSWDDSNICGGSRTCGAHEECVKGLNNINYGKSHFDNVLMSMLTIFQSVTLEGWTAVMNGLEKSMGMFVVIFYIPIVLMGAFFFMNMTLVAMKTSFTQINKRVLEGKSEVLDDSDDESEKQMDAARSEMLSPSIAPEKQQTREETPHILSKTVTVLNNHEFFPLNIQEKHVKMRQSSVEITNNPRVPSFGSDESLLVSKESLSSHEYVGNPEAPPSPLQSESVRYRGHPNVVINEEALTLKLGGEILQEEPQFTDQSKRDFLLVPKMSLNAAFSEYQLSSQISSVQGVIESLPLFSPEELLLKMTFFKKKLKKMEKNHTRSRTSWKLIEVSELKSSSKTDVLISSKSPKPKVFMPQCGFIYIDNFEEPISVKEEVSEDGSEESSESQIENVTFQQFLKLCAVMTSKEAYCKMVPLAIEKIMQQSEDYEERMRIEGEWSGRDVNTKVTKVHDDAKESEEVLPRHDQLNHFEYILWRRGFCGCLQRFQSPFRMFINTSYFNIFFTVCVVLNTIVLAINHYGIDAETASALDTCNLVFTIIFCVEMILKMTGLGIIGYFCDKMNVFDCIVVTLSLIELSFMSGSGLSALRAIRVFRAFRALRVARLFRSMKYMQKILQMIGKSIQNFVYMGLLLFLFMVVFALFGMQLFGKKFDFPDGQPRSKYDNFHYAFLTTFQILTMENWFQVMYSGMRTSMGNWASIYFIIWVFFGNFVLLNLFLAILLDSFENLSDEDEVNLEDLCKLETSEKLNMSKSATMLSKRKQKKLETMLKKVAAIEEEESLESASASNSFNHEKSTKELFAGNNCEKSYFLFSKESKLRLWCYKITSSNRFEWGIMFLIFISSLKLIWETYLFDEPSGSTKLEISTDIDFAFTTLFFLEFLLKSISLGFVLSKGTYLRETWNILDFIIVVFSLVDIMTTGVNLQIIKVFRLLRALRPLRFISHNKSMRIIVNALLESFGALANVAVVILIVWLIFAILGVSLMMGKEYSCSNPEIDVETDCLYYGFSWVNSPNHFDNIIAAYQSLFILTSQENWPDQMYQGTDTYEIGHAMKEDSNPYMAYFFVFFEVVSNIFFLNLLLGVMFDKFERAKRSTSSISELLLQNEQMRWVEMMKFIIRTKREQIETQITTKAQLVVCRIINHWSFSSFIMCCIVGNMISMALAYDEASAEYTKALEDLNLTFTSIFCLEAILKIYGLTPKGYFSDRWNCFDFLVVLSSLLDIILSLTVFSGGSNKMLTVGPQLARTLRILRVSRLFRLVKRLRMIDELVGMMSLSIPAIANVFALLVLVFTIYGVLGVYLFHGNSYGIVVDEANNFSNFGYAVLVLIRSSTGEDWNYLEWDTSNHTSSVIATIYFQTFVSITTFIMYNMFIMVMLQEYESYHNNPTGSSLFQFKERLKKFNEAWNACISSEKKNRMDVEGLLAFAKMMGPDLEIKPEMAVFDIKKHLNLLGITPDSQGFIYYHEALFRCFRIMFGVRKRIKNKYQRKLVEKEEIIHMKKVRKLVKIDQLSSVTQLMHRPDTARSTSEMQLMDMIFVKSVFRSWKGYSESRKRNPEVSQTPPMSINNPGVNSPDMSILDDEEEKLEEKLEGKQEESIRRTSQQTLHAPTALTEASTARDIKISRTSTNFSRPRNDTQE